MILLRLNKLSKFVCAPPDAVIFYGNGRRRESGEDAAAIVACRCQVVHSRAPGALLGFYRVSSFLGVNRPVVASNERLGATATSNGRQWLLDARSSNNGS